MEDSSHFVENFDVLVDDFAEDMNADSALDDTTSEEERNWKKTLEEAKEFRSAIPIGSRLIFYPFSETLSTRFHVLDRLDLVCKAETRKLRLQHWITGLTMEERLTPRVCLDYSGILCGTRGFVVAVIDEGRIDHV